MRELRSKYSVQGSQRAAVRSASSPERMFERRHSSGSAAALLGDAAALTAPPRRDTGREERSKRLQRAHSLDPRLSAAQLGELQRLQDQVAHGDHAGYYVAAEAPLQGDPERKIVVMEKLPGPGAPEDDSYVQIRSPTSREKISIMAVIDRCRAYQDSDEYRRREEARPAGGDAAAGGAGPGEDQETQQSIVKNLRDKFQSLS